MAPQKQPAPGGSEAQNQSRLHSFLAELPEDSIEVRDEQYKAGVSENEGNQRGLSREVDEEGFDDEYKYSSDSEVYENTQRNKSVSFHLPMSSELEVSDPHPTFHSNFGTLTDTLPLLSKRPKPTPINKSHSFSGYIHSSPSSPSTIIPNTYSENQDNSMFGRIDERAIKLKCGLLEDPMLCWTNREVLTTDDYVDEYESDSSLELILDSLHVLRQKEQQWTKVKAEEARKKREADAVINGLTTIRIADEKEADISEEVVIKPAVQADIEQTEEEPKKAESKKKKDKKKKKKHKKKKKTRASVAEEENEDDKSVASVLELSEADVDSDVEDTKKRNKSKRGSSSPGSIDSKASCFDLDTLRVSLKSDSSAPVFMSDPTSSAQTSTQRRTARLADLREEADKQDEEEPPAESESNAPEGEELPEGCPEPQFGVQYDPERQITLGSKLKLGQTVFAVDFSNGKAFRKGKIVSQEADNAYTVKFGAFRKQKGTHRLDIQTERPRIKGGGSRWRYRLFGKRKKVLEEIEKGDLKGVLECIVMQPDCVEEAGVLEKAVDKGEEEIVKVLLRYGATGGSELVRAASASMQKVLVEFGHGKVGDVDDRASSKIML